MVRVHASGLARVLAVAALSAATAGACASEAIDLQALMERCAPGVHPETMRAIVKQESMARPFALSDDGPMHLPWSQRKRMLRSFYPHDKAGAVAMATALIKQGHLVGIGLTQISSRHLTARGISVASAFDPCTNLKYGAQILTEFYTEARKTRDPDSALLAAISAYNTGSFVGGLQNGYVEKVLKRGGYTVPGLALAGRPAPSGRSSSSSRAVPPTNDLATSRAQALLAAKFATLEIESY